MFAIVLRTSTVFRRKVWSEYTKWRVVLGEFEARAMRDSHVTISAFGASRLASCDLQNKTKTDYIAVYKNQLNEVLK